MNLLEEETEVGNIRSRLDYLRTAIEQEKVTLKRSNKSLRLTQEAQETLQHLSQAVQQRAHEKISEVVSSCLSAVFEDPYAFRIEFDRKRGRTEARLQFTRRGMVVDPLTASGGGVVDVAAFALRVACLMLHRPRLSRVVVLDEPFRFVSAQYQKGVRQMLEELSEKMGMQIIQVTHNENLVAGKVVEL